MTSWIKQRYELRAYFMGLYGIQPDMDIKSEPEPDEAFEPDDIVPVNCIDLRSFGAVLITQ